MNEFIFEEGIKKQELNLIFVIDKSGSMDGDKIGAVNNAIRDVLAIMPEIQEDTTNAEIKISAITFSDNADWVNESPKSIEEFKWNDIGAYGGTDYNKVCDKLATFLSKKMNGGQMPDFGGVAPIIILMSDGMPTSSDWEQHLDALKRKGWFKTALKYALAIKIDTKEAMDVLTKFTGNPETVLKVYSAEALRQVIKVIAVTASKVKSSNSLINSETGTIQTKEEEAIEEIATQLDDLDDVEW